MYQGKDFGNSPLREDIKRFIAFSSNSSFLQSKLSLTTDLNTTHVVLNKSLRDVQQIDHFDGQFNKSEFIRDCYQKATSSS